MLKENKMCLIVRTVMALISTHIGTRYRQVLKGKYLYLYSVLKKLTYIVVVSGTEPCTVVVTFSFWGENSVTKCKTNSLKSGEFCPFISVGFDFDCGDRRSDNIQYKDLFTANR